MSDAEQPDRASKGVKGIPTLSLANIGSDKEPSEELYASPTNLLRSPRLSLDLQSINEENHLAPEDDEIEKEKLVECVADLWDVNTRTFDAALLRLFGLTQRAQNLRFIRLANAIPILLECLEDIERPPLSQRQCWVIKILSALSLNGSNREEISRKNGFAVLLQVLRMSFTENYVSPVLGETLIIFKELSKHKKNLLLFKRENLVALVLPLLSSLLSDEIACLILDIIYIHTLADASYRVTLLKDDRFVELGFLILKRESKETKKRALRTLGAVIKDNTPAKKILRKESWYISLITKHLNNEPEDIQEAAALVLGYAADQDTENQIMIHNSGAWTSLIRLLCLPNEALKGAAAAAIRSLVKGNVSLQNNIREMGLAIPLLVDVLLLENSEVQIDSAAALLELARSNSKNQKAIFEQDIVGATLKALRSENPLLQYLSGGIIWSLSRKSNTRRKAFCDAGAMEALQLLCKSSNETLRQGSEWALQSLKARW